MNDDYNAPIEPSFFGMPGGSLFGIGPTEQQNKSFMDSFKEVTVAKGKDDENYGDLFRDPKEIARDAGLVVVDSENRKLWPHLQIDLDSTDAENQFLENWKEWNEKFGPGHTIEANVLRTVSQNGNSHYYIKTPAFPMAERIAIQSLLGSDPKREQYCWLRMHRRGVGLGNVLLFEMHEEAERVWQFLAKEPNKVSFDEAAPAEPQIPKGPLGMEVPY